jgi:hypothetical protein
MTTHGFSSHLDAERLRCARTKKGSVMMARQPLQTDLHRRRDLTGSRTRISRTISSDSSGIGSAGGVSVFVLLFLFRHVFFLFWFIASMQSEQRKIED